MRAARSVRMLVSGAACLALATQGCATMGGPGARACAPYLIGGAALGAGLGAATSGAKGERTRRGAAGAAIGATAGYAICVQVWKQKRELETQFEALDRAAPTPAVTTPGTAEPKPDRIVRTIDVVENSAIRLDLDLMFATAQTRLEPRVISYLQVLAASLIQHPNSNVRIIGHTDDVGDVGRNRVLSRNRAQAVAAYLAAQGVGWNRLQVAGMGSDQPVVDNNTIAGRARNRRVEVFIQPTAAE